MGDENAWVFDSLICFLHGPVWNAPILTFIEENSLIFDPNSEQCDNEEFKRLHTEYKNLVDFMLGSFMEEMCISPEQFEMACLEGKSGQENGLPLPFQKGLFQQIWAANDLHKFIDMMKKRNIEIQMQALELIERRCGRTPKSCITSDQDDEILKEIFEQANDESSISNEHESLDFTQTPHEKVLAANTNMGQGSIKNEHPLNNTIKNLRFDNKKEVDASELEERKKYLIAQRDKLLALKKEIRSKKLAENEISNRPMSSKVQQLLNGTIKMENKPDSENKNTNELNITLRKALANRLKQEVVQPEHQSGSSTTKL